MPKPYRKNPRKITQKQLENLETTLAELGDLSGIVHNLNTDEIIGGNQRSKVFRLDECEIVLTEEYAQPDEQGTVGLGFVVWRGKHYAYRAVRWDERTAERANIVANRAGGDWDFEMLATEFSAPDLVAWGFEPGELGMEDMLSTPLEDPGPQTDRAEELREKWAVESGQMWILDSGKGYAHRLICGDCTDRAVVERVMGGERAQLIVTSPPYNQNLDTFKPSGMQKESPSFVNRMASSYADSMPEDEYQSWQKQLLRLWLDFVASNASCFYNHKIRYRDKRVLSPFEWLTDCGWSIRQEIIWDRGSSITLNARMFIPADERIYWLRAGNDFVFNDTAEIKAWSTVWEIGAKNDVSISAAFATEIPTRCIIAASASGDIVAEPFSGSGTTLIACEQLGRKCRAIEIAPGYVAVALERWATATGNTPMLA